jgi:isoleucyl-tRNA synthetase
MSRDYRSTVHLPKTDFPMKARLPEREPALLERWAKMDIYRQLRERSKGREKFILHDGPPYANGHLHIGHALNKILKDIINRSQQMLGRDANYVPGWDCHGLPIEWKIEERYRKKGLDKDKVPLVEFRDECRQFAGKWIAVQGAEFQRLGIVGDWDNPYTTMAFAAEAQIIRELGKFLMQGSLYRGKRPVMWSVTEKTALAEAEVEYLDHESTAIHVRFPVIASPFAEFEGAAVVIWTTTPWTIPGNRAVAYGEAIDYVVIEVTGCAERGGAIPGERLVLAAALLDDVLEAAGITDHRLIVRIRGGELAGTVCAHPLRGQGYEFEVPLLPGAHVTTEQGSGFVHTAPGHGVEDFELGARFDLEVPDMVGGNGIFADDIPLFAGLHIFKADREVVAALDAAGALLARATLVHSYPHSWRSRAPLIFRTTPQWFIGLERQGLREKALAAIDATRWVPAAMHTRIHSMVDSRPDWCVSRQRAWGVPIPVFVHRQSGEPLRDAAVVERVAKAIEKEGADAWFVSDPARFLGPDYNPEDFDQVRDILDVWFDSGSTHAFVLEARDDLESPASLYVEGSDQHRGWFQSSLLESCGTRGQAPYKAVLTHGFVMAEDGRKMSKSLGNVVSPQDIVGTQGADVLRLWVVASDYAEDLRIGADIIKAQVEVYRRFRNTLRYLLGNLNGFSEDERVGYAELPEFERWILHRLAEIDKLLRRCCEDFDFHVLYTEIRNFCAIDLSAFYFDVRKDLLYCDAPDSHRRRSVRTVLDRIIHCLLPWLAPVLCFTAEEAWLTLHPEADDAEPGSSVHFEPFPEVPEEWHDPALADKWRAVRQLRRTVTGALERERASGNIGSSLQSHPVVYATPDYVAAMAGVDLAEIAISSTATLHPGEGPPDAFVIEETPGVAVVPGLAEGSKCGRCWRILPEVDPEAEDSLCGRCAEAVNRPAAPA